MFINQQKTQEPAENAGSKNWAMINHCEGYKNRAHPSLLCVATGACLAFIDSLCQLFLVTIKLVREARTLK